MTLVAGPDRAGLDLGSRNVLVGDRPVLVADQAVRGDDVRVELTWTLASRATVWSVPVRPSLNSWRASSSDVDVGVEAIALVGQLLEQGVVVVAHADADRDQVDAGGGIVADPAQDPVRVGQARRWRRRPTRGRPG